MQVATFIVLSFAGIISTLLLCLMVLLFARSKERAMLNIALIAGVSVLTIGAVGSLLNLAYEFLTI